eukprot:gene19601-51975_t
MMVDVDADDAPDADPGTAAAGGRDGVEGGRVGGAAAGERDGAPGGAEVGGGGTGVTSMMRGKDAPVGCGPTKSAKKLTEMQKGQTWPAMWMAAQYWGNWTVTPKVTQKARGRALHWAA